MEYFTLEKKEDIGLKGNIAIPTLFRNKRFAFNEMFQQNASKFAIIYV